MLPNYSIWITGGHVHINRPDHPESMVISERQAAHHLMTYDDIRRQSDDLLAALIRLVACPDVNLDTLSPETIVAADQARDAIRKARGQ
jgi:hypothetical protein